MTEEQAILAVTALSVRLRHVHGVSNRDTATFFLCEAASVALEAGCTEAAFLEEARAVLEAVVDAAKVVRR